MTTHPTRAIVPPTGKLGVLTPGMGAVTTTFIAGVAAVNQELAKPLGSVTQMAEFASVSEPSTITLSSETSFRSSTPNASRSVAGTSMKTTATRQLARPASWPRIYWKASAEP